MTNTKPLYKRILLKLSGEALMGDQPYGIDPDMINRVANEIKVIVEQGVHNKDSRIRGFKDSRGRGVEASMGEVSLLNLLLSSSLITVN